MNEIQAEAEEIPTAEVVEYEQPQSQTLFRTNDPAEVLVRATATANALAPVIESKGLFTQIGDKRHIWVEGWTTLGAMLGVTPVCTWTHKLDNGWEARVEARTLDGRVIGAAEAECLRDEKRWASADDYAVRSMAQTRATSKALGSVLRFVATLAGFSGTPEEEMPRDGGSEAWRDEPASGSQKGAITRTCNELGFSDEDKRELFEWAGGEPLTKGKASAILDVIKEAKDCADAMTKPGFERSGDDLPGSEQQTLGEDGA